MQISIEEKEVKVKKKMIALELPQPLYEQIQKVGEDLCLSVSAVVRLALIKYLENTDAAKLNER